MKNLFVRKPLLLPFSSLSPVGDVRKITPHPFIALTNVYGDVVAYRGELHVKDYLVNDPLNFSGRNVLTRNGQKIFLRPIGTIDRWLPPAIDIATGVSTELLAQQTSYWYQNAEKSNEALFCQVKPTYRRQKVLELFQQPFLMTPNSLLGSVGFSSSAKAVLQTDANFVSLGDSADSVLKYYQLKKNEDEASTYFQKSTLFSDRPIRYNITQTRIGDEVEFISTVPKHQIIVDNKTFEFPSISLKTSCLVYKNAFFLKNYPCPVKKYPHFFVFDTSGEICYNGDDRFKQTGIVIGNRCHLQDIGLPYKLAQTIWHGQDNLMNGYKLGCRPAQQPSTLTSFVTRQK